MGGKAGAADLWRYIDWIRPRTTRSGRQPVPHGRAGGTGEEVRRAGLGPVRERHPASVVECKSPYLSAPMEEAIDQLQRYANQRTWVEGTKATRSSSTRTSS
jgi:hypothetical protein